MLLSWSWSDFSQVLFIRNRTHSKLPTIWELFTLMPAKSHSNLKPPRIKTHRFHTPNVSIASGWKNSMNQRNHNDKFWGWWLYSNHHPIKTHAIWPSQSMFLRPTNYQNGFRNTFKKLMDCPFLMHRFFPLICSITHDGSMGLVLVLHMFTYTNLP